MQRSTFIYLSFAVLQTILLGACKGETPPTKSEDIPPSKIPSKENFPIQPQATTPTTPSDKSNVVSVNENRKDGETSTTSSPEPAGDTTASNVAEKDVEENPPKDKSVFLEEAKSTKTADARAFEALEEAETLGATAQEVAKVANQRGEKLFGKDDRAQPFFEWARDKDPKNPQPSFNLAKITALQGDVEQTLAHLEEVQKRGGKKLLKNAEFDPMFEVVKDDPKFQSMLR